MLMRVCALSVSLSLSLSPTPLASVASQAMIQYSPEHKAVQLIADRVYEEGETLTAWCGPQPNSRLLLNYGLVDENNPYDKLQMTITLPNSDPLFREKRAKLQPFQLATQQTFDLARGKPLPAALLPYMRLALATTSEQVREKKNEAVRRRFRTGSECV